MTVVLDTSTWISALQFGGIPEMAAELASTAGHIAVCSHIEREIHRVLTEKFGWPERRVRARLAIYWANALHVETTGAISGVCRDPKDDAIIECAVIANAVLVVTGDHDLLELRRYRDVRIITARQYVERADAAAQ